MDTNAGTAPSAPKVLLIEDAEDWRQLLTTAFQGAGFTTLSVGDGNQAVGAFLEFQPDLVLLDLMLPGMFGDKVCEQIRLVSTVPLIVHSGLAGEMGKVESLRVGADDYVVKGTSLRELIARARASIRRAGGTTVALATQSPYRDAVMTIDFSEQVVSIRGVPVQLTPIEYQLLSMLVANPGKTFRAVELLKEVWGPEYATAALVKWHIGRLRKKVELDPKTPDLIVTRWGYGYAYLPPSV